MHGSCKVCLYIMHVLISCTTYYSAPQRAWAWLWLLLDVSVGLTAYSACCRSGGAHSSNMAKLANAPKLDGLDVTLFSRAPPEARPSAFVTLLPGPI